MCVLCVAQFSLWAVMAAPLLIGSNVLNMSAWDYQTYTNAEVIAIDQDSLGCVTLANVVLHSGVVLELQCAPPNTHVIYTSE